MINWIHCSCFQLPFACLLVLLRHWVYFPGPRKRRPDSRLRLSGTRLKLKAFRFQICFRRVGTPGSIAEECRRRVAWNKAAFPVPKTSSLVMNGRWHKVRQDLKKNYRKCALYTLFTREKMSVG